MKYLTIIFIVSIFFGNIMAQDDDTSFSKESYRRGNTAPQYRYDSRLRKECEDLIEKNNMELAKKKLQEYFDGKYFLPTYDDLATSGQGVSEKDWSFHLLPLSEFYRLDKDNNKYLSKEELDEHPLMGTAVQHKQTRFDMIKYLKDNAVENHEDRIRELQKLNYDLNEETYYVDPDNNAPQNVPTKTYVRVENGQLVVKQMPLPQYANTLINDQDEDDPTTMYIMGLVLVCLTAAGTIIITKFS